MISPVIGWYFKQRGKEFRENIGQALRKQDELFQDLMEQLTQTEYGRKYSIEKNESYTDFAAKVPLATIEDLLPYIERMKAGEQQLLWPGDIKWFAKSSGTTTNVSKFIPMSYEIMEYNHLEGGKEALSQFFALYPDATIFGGKGLMIGGSTQQSDNEDGFSYGDLSGILMNHLPSWANWKTTPDVKVATIDNWEDKLEHMVQIIKDENVTSVSGVPTWTAVVMQRVLEVTGKQNILEVWPNFQLFLHGGVNFAPYREQFRKLLPGHQVKYLETYNASEGFFGVQYEADKPELVLVTHLGVFYEFFPVSVGATPENVIPLSKVVTGVNYAVVISTLGGLWRYILGDTVQFVTTEPYTFTITGRTKLFINAFGEELVIENAEKAIALAMSATQAVVTDYTVAPIYLDSEGDSGHEWIVEFSTEPTDIESFRSILDNALKDANDDYKSKRQGDIVMKSPKLVMVPQHTFHGWLKSKGKLGGQNKVPRLSNDRKIVEEIKQMIGLD